MRDVRRNLLVLGLAAMTLVGGIGRSGPPTAGDAPTTLTATPIAWSGWWSWPTTTTVGPTTTTTRATTTTTRATTTTTRATTTTTQATTTTTAGSATGAVAPSVAAEMLQLVNAKRSTGTTCGSVAYPRVATLTLHDRIARAAGAHAVDMATYDYFSHTGRDGSNPGTRLTRAGYAWRAYGENIAAGQQTPSSVISAWFASAGHCANFMSANLTQIGFGKGVSSSSRYGTYWVADLARPA
jgi:uncharacterized protein YkwD